MAQKKTLRASERDRADIQAERAVFCERMRQLDAKNLVFLDESGITTAMTPLYARARRGERAHGSAPGGWRRLTVLGALSGAGMVAAMSIPAATTTRIFLAFLQAVLVPELRRRHPNATVLMDNLSAHKPKAVETVLRGRAQAPLSAALFARSLAYRTRLVQAQECLAGRRGTHPRGARSRPRARPRQHQPRQRTRLV